MGIAMGFGLIVDNAIVVLENIYRRRKLGDDPAEVAAERGAREVVLPILAATLTTVVVLIPFVYLQGELQVYYVPLAIVVGFSLMASLFVAFSFIPGLASRDPGPTSGPMHGGAAVPGARPAPLRGLTVSLEATAAEALARWRRWLGRARGAGVAALALARQPPFMPWLVEGARFLPWRWPCEAGAGR
jgi:multidrug efflux pump subunit AcrB